MKKNIKYIAIAAVSVLTGFAASAQSAPQIKQNRKPSSPTDGLSPKVKAAIAANSSRKSLAAYQSYQAAAARMKPTVPPPPAASASTPAIGANQPVKQASITPSSSEELKSKLNANKQ